MNTTAAKFVNRNRNALTVVNLLLVLAVFQQLHGLLLHQTGRTNLVCTLPSILTVGSTALGMALVIGLNQLRPSWLAFVMQALLLSTGCGLLLKLLMVPL